MAISKTYFSRFQTIFRLNEQAANFEGDIEQLASKIDAESEILEKLEAETKLKENIDANGEEDQLTNRKKKMNQQVILSKEDRTLLGTIVALLHLITKYPYNCAFRVENPPFLFVL